MLLRTGHHPNNRLLDEASAALTETPKSRLHQQLARPLGRHDGPECLLYDGPAGRTRTEKVRVFRPGREPFEVEVFRAVNVAEHPDLRVPAMSGALHRLDDGETVEVPFVFHDPRACQFVLVIPQGARGREASERAMLLDQLMKEQDHAVPDYVRHFAIVYGHQALAHYVDDAEVMEIDLHELEPVEAPSSAAMHFTEPLLPDAGFSERAANELALVVDDERLWLFVQLVPSEAHAFFESSSDLLVQLETFDQVPVCSLSLRDHRTGTARHAYLNPVDKTDRTILELLHREFVAAVVVCDQSSRLLRSFRVEAPRAANAKLILDRTAHAPACTEKRWALAAEACRAAPPRPEELDGHPFVMEDPASDAAEALRRLRTLESWSARKRIDHALLAQSVPKTTFELSRRLIVADALRFGLAVSEKLAFQAVAFGLATDTRSLVQTLSQRFAQIVPLASEHGLEPSDVEANRLALERLAERHGTSTDSELSCTMEHSG